jgi:amino acid transporter
LYVWSGRAFGPFAAFLTGWTYYLANLPYFAGMLYFAASNALWVTGGGHHALESSPAWFISFALVALLVATLLNVLGLGIGKWLSSAGAAARCAATVLLLVLGLLAWQRFGSASPMTVSALRPRLSLNDRFSGRRSRSPFVGTGIPASLMGEIRNPRRTAPRARALAAPLILLVYVGGTFSVLVAVPCQDLNVMNGVMQAVERVGSHLGLAWLTPLAAVLVVITCLGSTSAYLGSVARIPFVAGIDHLLPKAFGRVHPRYGTPANALMTQTAIAMVFAVLGQAGTTVRGAYEVLVNMMVITTMLPFLGLFGAAIWLLSGGPGDDEARIPGGRDRVPACAVFGRLTTTPGNPPPSCRGRTARQAARGEQGDRTHRPGAQRRRRGHWNGMRHTRPSRTSAAETASWEGDHGRLSRRPPDAAHAATVYLLCAGTKSSSTASVRSGAAACLR